MNIEKHLTTILAKPGNQHLDTGVIRDDIAAILALTRGIPDREFLVALEIILAATRGEQPI